MTWQHKTGVTLDTVCQNLFLMIGDFFKYHSNLMSEKHLFLQISPS